MRCFTCRKVVQRPPASGIQRAQRTRDEDHPFRFVMRGKHVCRERPHSDPGRNTSQEHQHSRVHQGSLCRRQHYLSDLGCSAFPENALPGCLPFPLLPQHAAGRVSAPRLSGSSGPA